MFPVIIVIGQILGAYAFAILMLALFRKEPSLAAVITKSHFHHLGTLLFTFVLFWTVHFLWAIAGHLLGRFAG